jgi:hypothetical protein
METPNDWEGALREGLRQVHIPDISPSFDDTVLKALQRKQPFWPGLWISVRPAFAAMCCSLAATYVVVNLTLSSPVTATQPSAGPTPAPAASMALLDRAINQPVLRADSLRMLSLYPADIAPPEAPAQPPKPVRHVERLEPMLIA